MAHVEVTDPLGEYRPPHGLVGAAADQLVLHRVSVVHPATAQTTRTS